MKILDSMNMKGTSYVDAGNPRWANNGLSDSQLRELASRHEVASHTWSHPDMRRHSMRVVREELSRSKDYFENAIRRPVLGLAYPFGQYTDGSARIAKECGYLFARTTNEGITTFPPPNPHMWGISVSICDKSLRFLWKMTSRRTILSPLGRLYATNLAWNWRKLTPRLFKKVQLSNGVLHIFGHASELLRPRLDRIPRGLSSNNFSRRRLVCDQRNAIRNS
jgi:peptidoglycan/xylan/chitin deacetylase (PgdA/CDA1 family)